MAMVTDKCNGNHRKAALQKCTLLTVTSQNRFSDRARQASSADPEQVSWALFLASSTLLLLYPQPGDLDYLSVSQLPCAALVLWATGTTESSTPHPNRPSHLLTSFDQPYFFLSPLKYSVHYLLVLNTYLALGDSPNYCVGLCIGLRGDRPESYSRKKNELHLVRQSISTG